MNTISGKAIYQARTKKNISQEELAKGICTQATISVIENQNICSSFKLISEICYRLNLDLRDVILANKYADKMFVKIETEIRNHDYNAAQIEFKHIQEHRLEDEVSKVRYYSYGGVVFLLNKNYDEALYYLNSALQQSGDYIGMDLYRAIATLGLGWCYKKSGYTSKADSRSLKYVNDAVDIIKQYDVNSNRELEIAAIIYFSISKYYLEIDKPQKALKIIDKIIKALVSKKYMYKLDELLKLKAQALKVMGKYELSYGNELFSLCMGNLHSYDQVFDNERLLEFLNKIKDL